jgi:dipeptidase D
MTFVEALEPTVLWKHFDQILTIPRGSKDEDRMRQYVIGRAEAKGLDHRVDAVGNLVVIKAASPGREGAAITILQSHLDMVEEKNSDVIHDFAKDPISPQRDGEYLKASGTTLGSDNGIGVAAMLAVMESDDLVHGPLELLFTVDEETGLTGAKSFDSSLLEGRRLLNLDSEEEGAVYVGCAGGADSELSLAIELEEAPEGAVALAVSLAGLKGGHSGVDIHLQRGNALRLLARTLGAARRGTAFLLASLEGGSAHNAIPREARADLIIEEELKEKVVAAIQDEFASVQEEFRPVDPDMRLEITDAVSAERVWSAATTAKVLALLEALPHGVLGMSYDIPDLVETSTNLATVRASDEGLTVLLSSRSSVDSALTALRRRIQSIADLAGAEVSEDAGYPGWKPNLDSPLLKVVQEVTEKTLGSPPQIKAIHAGLECGIIGEKCSGMDMISFGPQIEFPHSPDERVRVDSVGRFYGLLTATLDELAKG